jgi:hypothetical protein
LITKNLHGDKIVGLWLIRRVDEDAGRFVNYDKPLILKKNRERYHFEACGSTRGRILSGEMISVEA